MNPDVHSRASLLVLQVLSYMINKVNHMEQENTGKKVKEAQKRDLKVVYKLMGLTQSEHAHICS